MILTGDLHASPDELQYLKPEYLRKKYKSKCENTFIVILGDGGFLWHEDSYSDFNGELINTLNNWMKELNSTLIVIPGNKRLLLVFATPILAMFKTTKNKHFWKFCTEKSRFFCDKV